MPRSTKDDIDIITGGEADWILARPKTFKDPLCLTELTFSVLIICLYKSVFISEYIRVGSTLHQRVSLCTEAEASSTLTLAVDVQWLSLN